MAPAVKSKLDLRGLKESLIKGPGMYKDLRLETPFVWTLPSVIENYMCKSDLDRLIKRKDVQLCTSIVERVGVFILDLFVKYFLKRLFEQVDLKATFDDMVQQIKSSQDDLNLTQQSAEDLRTQLVFVMKCTWYIIEYLKEGYNSDKPLPEAPASTVHIDGIKAWFYMNTYEHKQAVDLFKRACRYTDSVEIYGFWYGKTLGRLRRDVGQYDVTDEEMEMLLKGEWNFLNIPTILSSIKFKFKEGREKEKLEKKYTELMVTAWEKRQDYASTNLTRIATLYWKDGDVEKAKTLFALALKSDSTCGMSLHKYGSFLVETKTDVTKGVELLIKANHMPAFLTMLRNVDITPRIMPSLACCLEMLEHGVTSIDQGIRFVLYRYYLDHGMNAKASFHMKILYNEYRDSGTDFELSQSKGVLKKLHTYLKLKNFLPDKIALLEEINRFRRICKEYDTWLLESQSSGYSDFIIETE